MRESANHSNLLSSGKDQRRWTLWDSLGFVPSRYFWRKEIALRRKSDESLLLTASLTLPRTQSLKKTSSASGDATVTAAASSATDVVVKDVVDKVSGANSSTSVYDNVNAAAAASKRNVSTYATLRQPAPTTIDSATKDVAAPTKMAADQPVATAAASVESKSSETQTVTTQTTQTPAVPPAASEPPAPLQSITHRTQQPLPSAQPSNVYQQQQQQQYPPAFQPQQQQLYGAQNYYNHGAIPRTYPQQQPPMPYHGMHPQQQQQTLNRSGYYGAPVGNYPNFGTLPPQMYSSSNRSDSGSYSHHPQHPHQQQQQHPHHHPYYERAYSVQGDVSNDMMVHDMRRSAGRPPHHSGHNHPHRRDLISSKSVDYSTAMDGGGGGGDGGASNGFLDDQLRARRHRSRSTENVVGNELLGSSKSDLMAGSGILDSDALKRMLQPVQNPGGIAAGLSPNASPLTSPEMSRRGPSSHRTLISDGFQSEPEIGR